MKTRYRVCRERRVVQSPSVFASLRRDRSAVASAFVRLRRDKSLESCMASTQWRDTMPKGEDDPPSSDFGATRNEDEEDFGAIRRQWLGCVHLCADICG
jgi:hypothetical protein